MIKIMTLGLSVSCAAMLSACSIGVTHDSTSIKQIREAKLKDGNVTRIGYTPAAAEWQCKELYKKTGALAMNKLKGALSWGGSYQALQNDAIEYANQVHLKTNYIFLYSPTETSVNGINLAMFDQSSATFYQCKQPPALTNKIF